MYSWTFWWVLNLLINRPKAPWHGIIQPALVADGSILDTLELGRGSRLFLSELICTIGFIHLPIKLWYYYLSETVVVHWLVDKYISLGPQVRFPWTKGFVLYLSSWLQDSGSYCAFQHPEVHRDKKGRRACGREERFGEGSSLWIILWVWMYCTT